MKMTIVNVHNFIPLDCNMNCDKITVIIKSKWYNNIINNIIMLYYNTVVHRKYMCKSDNLDVNLSQ